MKSNQPNDSQKKSDWYFPTDLGCLLFSWIWIVVIAFLAGGILPLIAKLKSVDILEIFYVALGSAAVGQFFFFARDCRFTGNDGFLLSVQKIWREFTKSFIGWLMYLWP
jgi:hypothetical protein